MAQVRVSLGLTLLLALPACGQEAAPPGLAPEEAVARAAVRPGDGSSRDQALASGVLRADPSTGCLWLEQEEGSGGSQLLLVGDDYRVNFSADPPEVLDGDDVVARVGEQVEVGGGAGTVGGVPGCPFEGPIFFGYFE
jgi:hypothetical protein